MSRFAFFTIIVSLVMYTSTGAATHSEKPKISLSMDTAIELAMENNRDILIAKEAQNRAFQQVREARAGAFPEFNLDANYTRTLKKPVIFFNVNGEVVRFSPGFDNSLMQTMTINQTLYAGGKTWAAIRIASLYSDSFEESLKQARNNVTLQVRQTFLTVLLSKEVLKINQRSLENAEAHLNNIKAMYKSGMAAEFDLLRAEVEVANARPKVIQAENTLVLQIDLLKNIIGMPLDQDIEIEGSLEPDMLDEVYIEESSRQAYDSRHDYKNLSLIRDAYNESIKIERGNWLPRVSAHYTFQYQGQSNTFDFENSSKTQNVSLSLSLPIFDGFSTSSRVQQARINVREADFQLMKLREGIEIQIAQARNSMEDARRRMDSTIKTVELAQTTYSIALVRFESGQGTQLEIFDSQVALELAQLNRLQSIYDHEIAKATWENAIGR
ncbi:TolC family protein [candidate division KSB1 bacterium]